MSEKKQLSHSTRILKYYAPNAEQTDLDAAELTKPSNKKLSKRAIERQIQLPPTAILNCASTTNCICCQSNQLLKINQTTPCSSCGLTWHWDCAVLERKLHCCTLVFNRFDQMCS